MIVIKPLAVACVVTASVYAAVAGTATAEFRVMVTITQSCAVAAGTASHASPGAIDAASAADGSGSGAIKVTCSNEIPYHVALQSVSSPNRESPGTPPGRGSNGVSTASTGNSLAGIGNGTTQVITVRPRVMSAQPARVSPNGPSDTVAVNVYY